VERGRDLLVTCLDEKLDIGRHEWYSHGDITSIGQDSILVSPLSLDTDHQPYSSAVVRWRVTHKEKI